MKFTHFTTFSLSVLFIGIVLLTSCSPKESATPDGKSPDDYNRSTMLSNYASGYILPAYTAYYTETSKLKTATETFTGTPNTTNLTALQTQWRDALNTWQDVAFLEFGPASEITLRAQTNIFPTDTTEIKANITSGTYDLKLAGNYDTKGFQAIDFLINGLADTDQEIATYYINTPNAKTYLKDLAAELNVNAKTVNDKWNNTYSDAFITNSNSNAQGSSVSDIINALNLHYESFIRRGKIGLPIDAFATFEPTPKPHLVEAYYSGESLTFTSRAIKAVQNFFNGKSYTTETDGEGLDDYLAFVEAKSGDTALESEINTKLNAISTKIDGLNASLSDEIVNNTSTVEVLYNAIGALVPDLKVRMTSALSTQITYNDTDGD